MRKKIMTDDGYYMNYGFTLARIDLQPYPILLSYKHYTLSTADMVYYWDESDEDYFDFGDEHEQAKDFIWRRNNIIYHVIWDIN